MFFDIREDLFRYRTAYKAHSKPMAVADLMQATDERLDRLKVSLSRLGPFWDSWERKDLAAFFAESDAVEFARERNRASAPVPRFMAERSLAFPSLGKVV